MSADKKPCNCDLTRPMTKGEAEIAKDLDDYFEKQEIIDLKIKDEQHDRE